VGTLKNNIYQYKDTTYHLPRFWRDIIFELIDKRESATFAIQSSDATRAVPFDFQLQINYTLAGKLIHYI
jgi:galactose mutarotase-like enzyme